jgi:hypothetical protein
MVVLLVVGTIIGLIWADTSDVAGAFAGVTDIVSGVGIVLLLIALAVKRRRRPSWLLRRRAARLVLVTVAFWRNRDKSFPRRTTFRRFAAKGLSRIVALPVGLRF